MPAKPSARDKILTAFEALLIEDGERGATMDAVAAQAGVSKGGLLYHFRNKEAMEVALLQKLRVLADTDVAAMAADPDGPSMYFVRESVYAGSSLDHTLIAAMRLGQSSEIDASAELQRIHQQWFELIVAEVPDRSIARAIMLLGDGLYYNATLAGVWPEDAGMGKQESVQGLLEVVQMLKRQADSRSQAHHAGNDGPQPHG